MSRSKKYKKALDALSKKSIFSIDEALKILPEINISKFKGSVELHIRLQFGKNKKIQIKGSITLPHQQAQSEKKIVVLTTPEFRDKAEGADFVGGEELIKKIEQGWNDFDIVIATPDIMPKIAILGRVLGPKGKMPNPKNDTVTTKLKDVISNFKKGRLDYKSDENGGIHQVIGKVGMSEKDLKENIMALLKSLYKEINLAGQVSVKSMYLVPTMGPSVKIDLKTAAKELT